NRNDVHRAGQRPLGCPSRHGPKAGGHAIHLIFKSLSTFAKHAHTWLIHAAQFACEYQLLDLSLGQGEAHGSGKEEGSKEAGGEEGARQEETGSQEGSRQEAGSKEEARGEEEDHEEEVAGS